MHAHREQQSLEMHRRIAAKLVANPDAVLAKACSNLAYWSERRAVRGAEAVLVEWRTLLQTLTIPEIITFICSENERAIRLRQSSPFAGVLSPEEVWEIKGFKGKALPLPALM